MKFLIYICIVLSFILSYSITHGECAIDYEGTDAISGMVDKCFKDTLVKVEPSGGLAAGDGTNKVINTLISSIGAVLSVVAILMIVYSGFLMTMSGGDDEKIKKGKDLLKWTVIGFIALVSAGGIISLLITTIFEFGAL